MEIKGVDIVLGAQWLETMGTVGLNLREQFIRFYENGRKYNIYNINCTPPQIVAFSQMETMIKEGSSSLLLTLLCYGNHRG